MADIKTQVQGLNPNLQARNVSEMADQSLNIYKTITIIQKRARILNVDLREELHGKLEEFAVVTDRIEEIQENKEQIEISKFYERLPNPAVIATTEFLEGRLTEVVEEIEGEEPVINNF